MKAFKKKKRIKLIHLSITLLMGVVLLLRSFNLTYALPTPTTTETTESRRPIGHKVAGAEYYDYLDEYDKHSIIITEGGGGAGDGSNGNGGNSSGGSGTSAGNQGNGGTGNTQGGSGGGFVGGNIGGTGTGNSGLASGTGSSMGTNAGSGGGTGSGYDGTAALRSLRQAIEESRAESYARLLETAEDKNKAMESIRERESIQESIKKEMAKESIMQKFYGETHTKESIAPTEANKNYAENNGPPETETSAKNTNNARWFFDIVDIFIPPESTKQPQVVDQTIEAPTNQYDRSNMYDENSIMPSESESFKYDFNEDIQMQEAVITNNLPETLSASSQQNAQYVRPIEPQDFIQETSKETKAKEETKETAEPTADPHESAKEVTTEATKAEETKDVPETQETVEEEGRGETKPEENEGAEGGKEREEEPDKAGVDNKDNQDSNDNGGGSGQGTTDGKQKGVKIFEIDAIGGIGAGESAVHIDLMKIIMNLILIICFISGFVFYYADIGYKRELKKGYF